MSFLSVNVFGFNSKRYEEDKKRLGEFICFARDTLAELGRDDKDVFFLDDEIMTNDELEEACLIFCRGICGGEAPDALIISLDSQHCNFKGKTVYNYDELTEKEKFWVEVLAELGRSEKNLPEMILEFLNEKINKC